MNRIKVATEGMTGQLPQLSEVERDFAELSQSVQKIAGRLQENRAGFVPSVSRRLLEVQLSVEMCHSTTQKLSQTLEHLATEYESCENHCNYDEVGSVQGGVSAGDNTTEDDSSNSWYHGGVSSEDGNHWVEATVGETTASFSTHAEFLTEDALINAGFDAAISYVLFQASAGSSAGNALLGYDAGGHITVGQVDGSVSGAFRIDENGVDAYVKGSAMVTAVEGEAHGTIKILGLEITGTAKGYVGAGAEGEIGIHDNKLVISGSAAVGLGGGVSLEIGLSDEAVKVINNIRNFVDFISFWK